MSGNVLDVLGHRHPRMLAFFIYGNLWRRKIRIGKGANGYRDLIGFAHRDVVHRGAAGGTEMKVCTRSFIPHAQIFRGCTVDDHVAARKACLSRKHAPGAPLTCQTVAMEIRSGSPRTSAVSRPQEHEARRELIGFRSLLGTSLRSGGRHRSIGANDPLESEAPMKARQ